MGQIGFSNKYPSLLYYLKIPFVFLSRHVSELSITLWRSLQPFMTLFTTWWVSPDWETRDTPAAGGEENIWQLTGEELKASVSRSFRHKYIATQDPKDTKYLQMYNGKMNVKWCYELYLHFSFKFNIITLSEVLNMYMIMWEWCRNFFFQFQEI